MRDDGRDKHIAAQFLKNIWGFQYDNKIEQVTSYLLNNMTNSGFDKLLEERTNNGMLKVNDPNFIISVLENAEQEKKAKFLKRRPKLPDPEEKKDTWVFVDAKKQVMRCDRCRKEAPLSKINGQEVKNAVDILNQFTEQHLKCKPSRLHNQKHLQKYTQTGMYRFER